MLTQAIQETNARRIANPADETDGRVCLIAGTPPPDRRLHAMVEAAGWHAVGPTLRESWDALGPPVEEGGDPFASVTAQLHALAHGGRAFFDRAAALLEDVRRSGAQAVMLWFAEEDEARIWDLPAQRAVLADAGVPALVLTRRDWRANAGEAEEIGPFLQGVAA
jgi:hypothetical protein